MNQSNEQRVVSPKAVFAQLRELGVTRGSVLLVHSSYSSIGPVEGGPEAFIGALIEAVGPDGTIVMPSWTDEGDEPFDPGRTSTYDHLGIVSEFFWRRPGVLRGAHPGAMAAHGPHARWIVDAPFVLPPHDLESGVDRVRQLGGSVLLAGVDHVSNTTIHLGELLAGVPYRQRYHVTVVEDGRQKRIEYEENDCCCRHFALVGDWLAARGLQRQGPLGHGTAVLARSHDIATTVIEELRHDRCRFLCVRGTGCDECDESWASVDPS